MEKLHRTDAKEVFNVTRRFEQIDSLRNHIGLVSIDHVAYGSQIVEPFDTPTIGIEIEMSWMQAFPAMAEKWKESTVRPNTLGVFSPAYREFHKTYDANDKALRPILEEIEHVIPRVGKDAYWEFSFLPSKHIGVSMAELQTLYDASILYDGIPYATHMTVAEIDNDRDAFAFLCGLELSGGSTPARIETAISSQKGSWARKGKGGILKRQPTELMGSDTKGYEFRTLVAQSAQQMSSLFHTAQQLANMVKNDPASWRAYRSHIESHLKAHNLALSTWGQPRQNQPQWLAYSKLLSDNTKTSQ